MNKHIMVLSIVAIFTVAGGVWLQYQDNVAPAQKDLLFADLLDSAAQIEKIGINNSSGNVFNANLDKGQWMAMVDLDDASGSYPVQHSKLAELLRAFTSARLAEAKTAKPANYQYLGLQGLDETDSLASLVTFTTQGDSWQVLVGNQASIGTGNYVRLPKARQSWLIDQNIDLPTDHAPAPQLQPRDQAARDLRPPDPGRARHGVLAQQEQPPSTHASAGRSWACWA